MPKALFLSLPSVSVVKTLTPVIDDIAAAGYEVIYYNTEQFRIPGKHNFRFQPYPASFQGHYSEKIDEHTSYFQFGELLIDMAANLIDFLLDQTRNEQPDIILHSHLAVWGKLLAGHFHLPAITLYTTFVLDKRIMLPFFRKIYGRQNPTQDNICEAIGFYRKSQQLYDRLSLKEKPDLWDIYINKGDLNISFVLDVFQPQRDILGAGFHFAGHPALYAGSRPAEKRLIYIAMGTILNKDLAFYKQCIEALSGPESPESLESPNIDTIISAGSMIDIAALGPVPRHISILPFVDQPAVLSESILFLTRGGMASVHEAIRSLTPVIVIPVIPEQQVTAEKIEELGIGIRLHPENLTTTILQDAIRLVLQQKEKYIANMQSLLARIPADNPGTQTLRHITKFFYNRTIIDLFIRQAAHKPHNTAIICEDLSLSYKELDERSNQLAHTLILYGIGKADIVPVICSHSLEMMIIMLAIMKTGAIYTPIDPEFPPARTNGLLQDMDCRWLCSQHIPAENTTLPQYCTHLLFDQILQDCQYQPLSPPSTLPVPSDAAYIIYTSGSTGKPKGVVIEHDQIFRYTADVCETMNLKTCRSFAMLGTFAADAGLTAVFAALCHGACLNIVNIKRFPDFSAIESYFSKYPVDCYKITPSLLDFLLQNGPVEQILPRKILILGGEPCPWPLAKSVYDRLPEKCTLFNHYGPTETTVGVITYRFPEKSEIFPPGIPLGKPLPHVRTHVLDADMQPLPTGETGELFIEGPLLARGYLNNPVTTAEKFITSVISGNPTRLYRTGDLVRQTPEGHIYYAGRTDDQVKINGHRIELKEIEGCILADSTVRQCIVLSKRSNNKKPFLTAYIVPRIGFSKDRLLLLLKQQLPAWMIPAAWIIIDAMPLTINNKIDRQSLPDPSDIPQHHISGTLPYISTPQRLTPGPEPQIPDLPTSRILSELWTGILGHKPSDTGQDFFSAGGDSLMLMQLGYAISARFSTPVSATLLFQYLDIESQASWLEKHSSSDTPPVRDPLPPFDNKTASLTQRNLYLQKILHPASTFPNSSITCQLLGAIDAVRLEAALKKVIGLHDALRTAFYFEKGKVLQSVKTSFDWNLDTAHFPHSDISQAIIDLTKPFDFSRPPLIRASLVLLGDGKTFFHLDLPHIDSDGESLKIIMAGITSFYNNPDHSPRHTFQYEDFLRHQHEYRHSTQYIADAAFWKNRFPRNINLPFGREAQRRKSSDPYAGTYHVGSLPEHLYLASEKILPQTGCSKFQFLLSACCLLIHKITGADDFTIMLPIHRRLEKEFSEVVGLLSNIVLFKTEIDSNMTIEAFFADSKTSILQSMGHQQYPFEDLANLLRENGLGNRNLSQAFFSYHQLPGSYDIGDARLLLCIPEKDKENLPLSMALFDTGSSLTIRWSSAAGIFDKQDLEDLMLQYQLILRSLIDTPQQHSVRSLLQKIMTPALHS